MLSLNLSFRCLVLKYIPQLISKDLDKFESLTAFRHQIKEDIRTIGWNQNREDINEISTHESNFTIEKSEPNNIQNFEHVQRLYIAKRNYALKQGNFQQTPASWEAFVDFYNAAKNYRIVQIQTLPALWWNRIKYFWTNFWDKLIVIILVLVAIGWTSFFNFPPEIISTPKITEKADSLYHYQLIAIDPNLDDSLTYSFNANPLSFSMAPDSGLITGTPLIGDTGTHSISVTVTDAGGLSDTQSYTLTVSP